MSLDELVKLTRQHLKQEYAQDSFVTTDLATYNYFKSLAMAKNTPVEEAPPLPIKASAAPRKTTPPPKKSEPKNDIKEVKKTPTAPQKTEPAEKLEFNKQDFTAVRTALKEAASHIKIVEEIPDDAAAKRMASSWKEDLPEVIIVADDATEQQLLLLEKISTAIESLGYSSKVFNNEVEWEKLFTAPHIKLMLMTQAFIEKTDHLKLKHRYDQGRKRHFIDGALLCPLPPLEQLQNEPPLKARLWQSIRLLLR